MYAKITNGAVDQYPYTIGDLRRENKNVSFPKNIPEEVLLEWGVVPVSEVPEPSIDVRLQKASQNSTPTQVNGSWVLEWTVTDKTPEEVAAFDAIEEQERRSYRNNALQASDWIVIYHTEKGTNIPLEWEVYRQALRDITNHPQWPYVPADEFPKAPA